MGKNLRAMQEMWQKPWVRTLGGEDPLEQEMATHSTLVFLPEKSHGQRNLVGYNPWGCKEQDTSEHTNITFYLEVKTIWSHFCLCKLIFYSLDRHIQINSENVLNIVDIRSKLSIKFKHIFYIHGNDLRERERECSLETYFPVKISCCSSELNVCN